PHLVVDGCDDPTFGFFYCNFNESGLLDDLRAKDFDIIIVRFRRGVDYVQNNTVLLIDMIDYINFEKETNGSHAENIVIGYSQGDLIAKYALAKMEKEFDFATIDQTGAHHSKLHVSYEGEHQGANTVLGMQHSLEGIVTVAHPLVILFGLLTVLHIAKQTYNSPAAKQLSVYHNSKTGNNKSPGQGQHSYRDDFESDLALTAHGNTDANKIGYPAFARNIGISSGSSIGSKMYNDDVGTNWEGMRIFKNTIVWAPLLSFLSPMSTKYAYFALNSNGDNPVYKKNYQVFGISLPPIRKTTSDPLPYDNAPGGWDGQLINAYTFAHLPVAGISLSPFIALDGYPEDCIKPVCGCFKECFTPTVSILDIKNKTVGSELIYNLATKGLFYNAGTPSAPLNTEPWGYPHLGHKNHYAVTPFDAVAATTTNDRHVKFEPPEFRNFLMGEIAPDDLKLQNRSIGKYQLGYVADFEATRITSGKNVTISTNEEDYVIEDQSTVRFRAGKEIILMPGFSSLNGSDFRAYIDLGLFSGSGCTPSPACKLSNSDKDKSGGRNAELSEPLEEKDDEQVLEEIKEPFSASIFPNPNSGQFTVKCAFQDRQSATLTIINLMGEYVYENQLNQTTSTIDISPHPKGVYFVKIVSGDEIIVKKVVYQ
ncbi:T9SS type A sorting domain-containing protein, partial [Bacteroidales bacterium AH-315-I05]|nr:T9SS type A sorting domain-containing protein [Bacteroidales bacterium AH-315-I05]